MSDGTSGRPGARRPGRRLDREAGLARQLAELADTVGDAERQDTSARLDVLVQACVSRLDVAAATLCLLEPEGDVHVAVAARDGVGLQELVQVQWEQGPFRSCLDDGEPVSVLDLCAEPHRWPLLTGVADQLGLRSLHALPLRWGTSVVGALSLFRSEPRLPTQAETAVAQALAHVTVAGLLQRQWVARAVGLAEELQEALDQRVLVEQAKGVLAARHGTSVEAAQLGLTTYARERGLELVEAAAEVVRGQHGPQPVDADGVRTVARPAGRAGRTQPGSGVRDAESG